MIEVIFDTNAYIDFYRDYLRKVDEEVRIETINSIKQKEQKKQFRKQLNFYVTCELINPLSKESEYYNYDAINCIYFAKTHCCEDVALYKNKLRLSEPSEAEDFRFVYGFEHPHISEMHKEVFNIVNSITKMPLNEINISTNKDDIEYVSRLLKSYKEAQIEHLRNSCVNLNNIYFKLNNKTERNIFLMGLKNYEQTNYKRLVDIRIKSVVCSPSNDFKYDKEKRLSYNDFINTKYFGLSSKIQFLYRSFSSYNNSNPFNYERNENDIIDYLILDTFPNESNCLFVTNEKKIHELFNELKRGDKVMFLDEYLKKIGFII